MDRWVTLAGRCRGGVLGLGVGLEDGRVGNVADFFKVDFDLDGMSGKESSKARISVSSKSTSAGLSGNPGFGSEGLDSSTKGLISVG